MSLRKKALSSPQACDVPQICFTSKLSNTDVLVIRDRAQSFAPAHPNLKTVQVQALLEDLGPIKELLQ